MQPISVEKFADMVMKNNKGYHKKELVKTLRETLAAKKNGARCMVCGAPIWAAGSAITGSNLCFTCTTGEADCPLPPCAPGPPPRSPIPRAAP